MPAVRDLYEILGVSRDATDEELKRAYRRKAREVHPDQGGDEEAFKELTAAYEVLRNPQARGNYDRYGDPRGPIGVGGRMGGDPFAGFGDLSDLIETFFGGFGRGPRRDGRGGNDALVDVRLTLQQAATGVAHEIDTVILRACQTCSGSGAAPGSGPVTCRMCQGTGTVQQVRNSVFGQLITSGTCPTCGGAGQRIMDPCKACFGEGRQRVTERITVPIPEGVADGTRLRLTGRGEAGRNGGPAGDLYVQVRIRPHEVFTRDGDDLHCELRVPMAAAALGTQVTLETLEGEEPLSVPSGTQTGDVVTLRRKGMPRLGGGGIQRGNLYVHCRVETPTKLTDEQANLIRRLAELRGEHVNEHAPGKGLFGRLREAFGA
ncbi:MAG: molecular chaperone DnaJ [Egibacteraceae bacterium]